MKKLIYFVPLIILIVLGVGAYLRLQGGESEGRSALEGQAPPVERFVSAIDDSPAESFATGDYLLVNFWASWCGPCRVEHPILMQLQEQGVPIYGVNYKDNPQKAALFLKDLGNPFTELYIDESGRGAFDWGLFGVPETFLLNGDGAVVARFAGPLTPAQWDSTFGDYFPDVSVSSVE
ncbi:DsbE family thiol:disulfide interchange protein [Paracoccaceae bacterium GXU_MW_L88]